MKNHQALFNRRDERELGTRLKGAIKRRADRPYYELDLSDDGYQHFEEFDAKYEQQESKRKIVEKKRKEPCQIPDSSVFSRPKKVSSNEMRPGITSYNSMEVFKLQGHVKDETIPVKAESMTSSFSGQLEKEPQNNSMQRIFFCRIIKAKGRISAKPWPSTKCSKGQCCHTVYRKQNKGYLCLQCYAKFKRRKDMEV